MDWASIGISLVVAILLIILKESIDRYKKVRDEAVFTDKQKDYIDARIEHKLNNYKHIADLKYVQRKDSTGD